jgi:hypothetical protein
MALSGNEPQKTAVVGTAINNVYKFEDLLNDLTAEQALNIFKLLSKGDPAHFTAVTESIDGKEVFTNFMFNAKGIVGTTGKANRIADVAAYLVDIINDKRKRSDGFLSQVNATQLGDAIITALGVLAIQNSTGVDEESGEALEIDPEVLKAIKLRLKVNPSKDSIRTLGTLIRAYKSVLHNGHETPDALVDFDCFVLFTVYSAGASNVEHKQWMRAMTSTFNPIFIANLNDVIPASSSSAERS